MRLSTLSRRRLSIANIQRARYSIYLLYWYKSTDTDAVKAAAEHSETYRELKELKELEGAAKYNIKK